MLPQSFLSLVNNPYVHLIHNEVVAAGAMQVLELGVGEGYSTVALLYAVEETRGFLHSIDHRDFAPGRERIVRDGPKSPRWRFLHVDDRTCVFPFSVEALYVDTSHEEEHTLLELERFVRPETRLVLLHDTLLLGEWDGHPVGVMSAVRRFTAAHPKWIFTELLPDDPGGCGLGKLVRA